MKPKTFKEDLAKVGLTYELIEKRFVKSLRADTLKELIRLSSYSSEVINKMCFWGTTKEKSDFWANKQGELEKLHRIAESDEVVHGYDIRRDDGDNWTVGCQKVNREKRLKLFKLLAEDLGYEIQD